MLTKLTERYSSERAANPPFCALTLRLWGTKRPPPQSRRNLLRASAPTDKAKKIHPKHTKLINKPF